MGSFVKVEDGVVIEAISAEQNFVDTLDGTWVQTSYNTVGGKHYDQDGNEDSGTPLRKNYAGIGYTYDSVRDAFYTPQPYASWTLNEDTCIWEPPVARPDDDKYYNWDEDNTAWVETEITE